MSIYVEILISGSMDDLWEKTQEPKLHERWDLRFSEIDYLPRGPEEPQKFLYSTRIGAGLRISGEGESVGECDDLSGQRTSALKFWSKDPKSLIEFGSGYWQYVPSERGIRFLTSYDYQTRFGAIGKVVDRLAFRPLIGWATAWSFDRLRLWMEQGIPPEVSRDRAFIYGLSRLTIAFIWLYHGMIPKLLFHNADELKMLTDAGVASSHLPNWVSLIGWLEVGFALTLVVLWRSRWPLWCTIAAMSAATLAVSIYSPAYLTAAFNPADFEFGGNSVGGGRIVGRREPAFCEELPAQAAGSQAMRSIYEQALGERFKSLHPRIQERFGFSSRDKRACIGTGTMDELWHGKPYTLPFLYLGSVRRIMFPERGRSVPFTIRNYAYVDEYGRETVTWIRNFATRRPRRFDAYMIFSQERGRIVDYLGTHQHLAVDIDLSVDERGGLRLRSGAQRFYEGLIEFSFPLLFSGVADVCEWYEEKDQRFHIEVNVENRTWGPLFGYRGSFDIEWTSDEVPADLLPVRCERRE